jgi:hypothetical protein
MKNLILLTIISAFLYGCVAPSETNSLEFNGSGFSTVSGSLIEENLDEQLIFEDIIDEVILNENFVVNYELNQIQVINSVLNPKYILEDIKVEFVLSENFEDYIDNFLVTEAYDFDIDWFSIYSKFAIGVAVIVITGTFAAISSASTAGAAAFVLAGSFKGALTGSITGAITGAAINSSISLLENGTNPSALKKYSLEGAADGFMWGAITGAVFGGINGGLDWSRASKVYDASGKALGIIDKSVQYSDDVGNISYKVKDAAGKITGEVIELPLKAKSDLGKTMYLLKGQSDEIIGVLSDNGSPMPKANWSKFKNRERQIAVREAWKQEVILVRETGTGTRAWTDSQIVELLTRGRVNGFAGHHGRSVLLYPQGMNDPNNIHFLTKLEHIAAHTINGKINYRYSSKNYWNYLSRIFST